MSRTGKGPGLAAGAPLLRRLITMGLDLAAKAQYQISVDGLAHFSGAPSTLVVANHRRDADVPIIGAALIGRHGPVQRPRLPHFVAREDLFRRGFLGHYLYAWPDPLRAFLAVIPLQRIMYTMQTYPMRRIPERVLREVLEDVLEMKGNLPLAAVLRPAWVEKFSRLAPGKAGELALADVLARRYHALLNTDYGLAKLSLAMFRQIRPAEQAVISRHLECFVQLLEQGEVVQIEPEGRLSRDGNMGRMRAGLHILLNMPKVAVRVLPVAVTYDAMTRGRPRAFVRFGPENATLQGLGRRETDDRVSRLLRGAMTVTASQLGCHYLHEWRCDPDLPVQADDLAVFFYEQGQVFSAAGAPVDPHLLLLDLCRDRANDFLDYCRSTRLLMPLRPGHYRFNTAARPEDAPDILACRTFDYMYNEWAVLAGTWGTAGGWLRPGLLECSGCDQFHESPR